MNCSIVWLSPAQRPSDQEQADREDDDRAPAEEVGQLAVDRAADRRGQQVDRDDPGVEVVAVEVGDDHRQGDADDRLVEGEQEHREQDRAEDLKSGALAHLDGGLLRRDADGHEVPLGTVGVGHDTVRSCQRASGISVRRGRDASRPRERNTMAVCRQPPSCAGATSRARAWRGRARSTHRRSRRPGSSGCPRAAGDSSTPPSVPPGPIRRRRATS